jgi:hypothetical protein
LSRSLAHTSIKYETGQKGGYKQPKKFSESRFLGQIFTELARGLLWWTPGVTPPARVVDKAEDAPTTDALFGQPDPLLSVYGNVLSFFPQGVVNCLATSCRDLVLLIEVARQRIRSRGCSARDLVIYHVDAVSGVV